MPDDVLALIDGALLDYETSDDAMRWAPGRPAAPKVTIDIRAIDQFTAAFADLGRQVNAYMAQMAVYMNQMGPQLVELAEALAGPPAAATRGAASPRVPTYRDRRPRWQSPYGPPGCTR